MKLWDVFISHASEDNAVARSLADGLRVAGLRVWLDETALQLGDSLSEKIDEGLARSRFGVVVLSPNFIAKRWPRQELNGLMALEESGQKVILPVWHELDQAALREYSPRLADRVAGRTADGIAAVTAEIARVVVAAGEPTEGGPTLARRFITLLDDDPEPIAIRQFLSAHSTIPALAVGVFGAPQHAVTTGVQIGEFEIDLSAWIKDQTANRTKWFLVQLDRSGQSPLGADGVAAPSVEHRVAGLDQLRRRVARDITWASEFLPDISPAFQGIVVGGRRALVDSDAVRRYNDELVGTTLRTYDWLIEAAASVD